MRGKTLDEIDAMVWDGENWVEREKIPCDECSRNCRQSIKAYNHFACRSGERAINQEE